MADEMPSSLFTEWAAFFGLEPFGYEIENWRTGQVCSLIANVNRNPKKKPDPYKPKDFMPKSRHKKKMKWQDIQQTIRGVFGGTTQRPNPKTDD